MIKPKPEGIPNARHSLHGSRPSIKVHIEELVLKGFARRDRRRIASAVERELARLMSESSAPHWQPIPPVIERIDAGAFRVEVGRKPEAAGAGIARAVLRSFRQYGRAATNAPPSSPEGRQP